MNDISSVVDRLGGPGFLSGRFDISTKAVEMWVRRGGIPGRWHIPLLFLAAEKGVTLSMNELSAAVTDFSSVEPAEARL